MEKLKTLQEMDICNAWKTEKEEFLGVISVKELKAEAVKWVKKYPHLHMCFIDFFNLTEEDLK